MPPFLANKDEYFVVIDKSGNKVKNRNRQSAILTGRLKMREWKMRYGQKWRGGKCRSRL